MQSAVTALHAAAAAGAVNILPARVAATGDVDARSPHPYRRTALHEAAAHNQTEAVEWLIASGANICSLDADGRTPLALALRSPAGICAAAALGKRTLAAQSARRGYTDASLLSSLVPRCPGDNSAAAMLLLSCGASPDLCDPFTLLTPLMLAVRLGDSQLALVHALLRAGANLNSVDAGGATAFRHAIFGGGVRVIDALARGGCVPRLPNDAMPFVRSSGVPISANQKERCEVVSGRDTAKRSSTKVRLVDAMTVTPLLATGDAPPRSVSGIPPVAMHSRASFVGEFPATHSLPQKSSRIDTRYSFGLAAVDSVDGPSTANRDAATRFRHGSSDSGWCAWQPHGVLRTGGCGGGVRAESTQLQVDASAEFSSYSLALRDTYGENSSAKGSATVTQNSASVAGAEIQVRDVKSEVAAVPRDQHDVASDPAGEFSSKDAWCTRYAFQRACLHRRLPLLALRQHLRAG